MKKHYKGLLLTILIVTVTGLGVFYAVRHSAVDCQEVIAEFMEQSKTDPLNELTAQVSKCMGKEENR